MALPASTPPSPGNASISVRDYIYFLPHPLPENTPVPYTPGLPDRNPLNYPASPSEPSSTLVLTSPARTFVDVRVLKPMKNDDGEGLPNEGGPKERLEWAFAGTSSSEVIADAFTVTTGGSYPTPGTRTFDGPITKAAWTHWVDSKHPVGTPSSQIPKDQGTMYPLSSTQTLEHGSSTDPVTGKTQAYEELWTDLQITPTHPSPNMVCVVLRLDATARGVRGVVVRLGAWCQAVLVEGGKTTVERWEFCEIGGEAGWTRRVRIGDAFLPCAATFKVEDVSVGALVKYYDYEWRVEEVEEWRET